MRIVESAATVRALGEGTRGLVPTMGALHAGHLSLVEAARDQCDQVIMSIYVNPLQFDDADDLARYPRDLDGDVARAEAAGVDILYLPSPQNMFSQPPLTTVTVAEVTEHMEGEHRPGHFTGVATIVTKLLASLRPDRSYFGRKDHQQLVMVRTLVADLSLPGEVVACPIVRDPDGLAISSRNVFIEDRDRALTLWGGLAAAADAVEDGERDGRRLTGIVAGSLEVDSVDYVTLASQARAQPLTRLDRPAFLAVAARVGPVRLIDNLPIDMVGELFVPDRGVIAGWGT